MTASLLYPTGTRLRLPAGRLGILVRWRVREIDPRNRRAGSERVAELHLGDGASEFSEAFIRRCVVIS